MRVLGCMIFIWLLLTACEKRNDWGSLAGGVGEVQRRAP